VPGGSLGFNPYMQAGGFSAPMPYYQPQAYQQPRSQSRPQQLPVPSSPIVYQTKPRPQLAPIAVPPQTDVIAARLVEVPSPERLGIRLDDSPAVVVPEPAKLGIKIE
jgi:hypothetical protein